MDTSQDKREAAIRRCLAEMERILRSDLKFGTVTVVVQDGLPVQIDTTEKKRF